MKSDEAQRRALKEMTPTRRSVNITVNTNDRPECKAVHCNVEDDYDLARPGIAGNGWVQYHLLAGVTYPYVCVGARHATGDTAPDANDINFEYD